jgi:hypothetical protein
MDCRTALLTILDQVDYTSGNCRPNEMVGAVLPKEVIALCREAAQQSVQTDACPRCDGEGRIWQADLSSKDVCYACRGTGKCQ